MAVESFNGSYIKITNILSNPYIDDAFGNYYSNGIFNLFYTMAKIEFNPNDLIGKYIPNYYDKAKDASLQKKFDYAFSDKVTAYTLDLNTMEVQ